jgi:hypothetical protein
MKSYLIKVYITLLACTVTHITLTAKEPGKIALSEIQMLPAHTNDPVRIEMINRSREKVDLSGWYVTDEYGHRYDFPKDVLVPTGALVVVSFGTTQGETKDDKSFKCNVAFLYCREPWSDKAFRGRTNECAVYEPSVEKKGEGRLHEYLMWGTRPSFTPTEAHKQALKEKLWSWMDEIIMGEDGITIGGINMFYGDSLARMDFQKPGRRSSMWFVTPRSSVTIGKPNVWPVPQPRALGKKNESELRNPQSFSWDGVCGEGEFFLVQISKNREFTDLILERVVPSLGVSYDQFKEGTYYWRVCINAPETERKWSETIEFTLVDMSKRRSWRPGDPPVKFKDKKDNGNGKEM